MKTTIAAATMILLLALMACATFAADEASQPVSTTGSVIYGRSIPISLSSGAGGEPNILRLQSVRFSRASRVVTAKISGQIVCAPRGGWDITLTLTDSGRVRLASGKTGFCNIGSIKKIGEIKPLEFEIECMLPARDVAKVKFFRLDVVEVECSKAAESH